MKAQDEHDRTMQGWIRPLSMSSIGIVPFEGAVERIDPALLVRDLCRDRPTDVLEAIKKRYLRVSTEDLDIFLVPPENLIFKRIVLPLKSAKQAFCFADFIACVALCGMVCEMAILFLCDLAASLWDMNRLRHKKILAGRNYKRLTQEQRVKALLKLGAIPDELAKDTHTVQTITGVYLHFLGTDDAGLEQDAYEAYRAASRVIRSLVALPLGEQEKLADPEDLKASLESTGSPQPPAPNPGGQE